MASNLNVLNALSDDIVTALAPYQPSVPPNFTNTSPVAGTIPNTVAGPGHPIQFPVTSTLEQGNAQVGAYFGKITRPMPFISSRLYQVPSGQTTGSVTNIYQETGRELKQLIIEVWAYRVEDRDAISNIVRGALGDAFRLSMPDGTTALLKWSGELEHDEEQVDSIWITQLFYMADVTRTLLVGTQPDLGTGYIVTEVDTYVQPEDDQGNAEGAALEVIVPNPSGGPNGT